MITWAAELAPKHAGWQRLHYKIAPQNSKIADNNSSRITSIPTGVLRNAKRHACTRESQVGLDWCFVVNSGYPELLYCIIPRFNYIIFNSEMHISQHKPLPDGEVLTIRSGAMLTETKHNCMPCSLDI